jgi:hypothetical protein
VENTPVKRLHTKTGVLLQIQGREQGAEHQRTRLRLKLSRRSELKRWHLQSRLCRIVLMEGALALMRCAAAAFFALAESM